MAEWILVNSLTISSIAYVVFSGKVRLRLGPFTWLADPNSQIILLGLNTGFVFSADSASLVKNFFMLHIYSLLLASGTCLGFSL